MNVLPSQRLTIGELFVSMAVGLILYLLPGDIRNQLNNIGLSELAVFVTVFIVTLVFFLIIKRYEAVGAALLTNSVIMICAFAFAAVNGFISKGAEYWPALSVYQLATMFIVWIVPFLFAVIVRMSINDHRDTDDSRLGFARFLSLSLRALMIIYILVLVFVEIIPKAPDMATNRSIMYMPFSRIKECIENAGEWGLRYLVWNGLILMPLTFSMLVINPKIRWWHTIFAAFAVGLTIEIFQFSLNTGTVYVDDFILYLTGAFIGIGLKSLIDRIRCHITHGQEEHMLSLEYTPVAIVPDNIEVVEDDVLTDMKIVVDDFDEELDNTIEEGEPISFKGSDEVE